MKPLIILLSLTTLTFGRIGETPAECTTRYGEPVNINKETKTISYTKAGLFIMITFHEGKACQFIAAKSEKDVLGNFLEMSEVERDTILKANAGDGEWVKKNQLIEFSPQWVNDKAKVVAQYTQPENMLIIMTLESVDRNAKLKEIEEKKALEGF
jgi:hypothetical protein